MSGRLPEETTTEEKAEKSASPCIEIIEVTLANILDQMKQRKAPISDFDVVSLEQRITQLEALGEEGKASLAKAENILSNAKVYNTELQIAALDSLYNKLSSKEKVSQKTLASLHEMELQLNDFPFKDLPEAMEQRLADLRIKVSDLQSNMNQELKDQQAMACARPYAFGQDFGLLREDAASERAQSPGKATRLTPTGPFSSLRLGGRPGPESDSEDEAIFYG